MSAGAGLSLIFSQLSMLLALFLDATGFYKRILETKDRAGIEYFACKFIKDLVIFLVVLLSAIIPFSIYIKTLDLIPGFFLLLVSFWFHGWIMSKEAKDILRHIR